MLTLPAATIYLQHATDEHGVSNQSTISSSQGLMRRPPNGIAYIAILAALVTGIIHLILVPLVIGSDQVTGILFLLNGLGFFGGVLVYLSRYWRRELYIVAIVYALATVIAFFVMGGPVNSFAIAAKAAEVILAVVSAYLYST